MDLPFFYFWVRFGDHRALYHIPIVIIPTLNQTLSSTEFVYLNRTLKPGPKLPYEIRSHCMASHEHYVFIIGGMISGSGLAKKEVLQYDGNNIWKKPTNRPNMHTGRRDLACTIFKSSKIHGRYLLIVAGGTSDAKHAEYLDFTNSNAKWVWTSKSCFSLSVFIIITL